MTLGHRVKIGTGCVIKNSVIGDDCDSPISVVEDANLAAACHSARLPVCVLVLSCSKVHTSVTLLR